MPAPLGNNCSSQNARRNFCGLAILLNTVKGDSQLDEKPAQRIDTHHLSGGLWTRLFSGNTRHNERFPKLALSVQSGLAFGE